MIGHKLRERLARGEWVGMINPHHTSTSLSVRLVELGADSVFLDCEHGSWSFEDIRNTSHAVRGAGGAAIVRPDNHQRSLLIRYLNCGADGLMVPMVESAEEARAIVDAVRYGCVADHQERLIICMIESAETIVHRLDEMLTVEGVDVFFIGPTDLTQSMGFVPGAVRPPAVVEMMELALDKITGAGRIGGTLVTREDAARWRQRGASFIYYHTDPFLRAGLSAFAAELQG